MKKESSHLYAHLRRARRLLELYWFVVRLSVPCPFHYMALREDEIKFVRVECACQRKQLTSDPALLITMPVPVGATKEVWFLPATRKHWTWEIKRIPAQLEEEWQKLYKKK